MLLKINRLLGDLVFTIKRRVIFLTRILSGNQHLGVLTMVKLAKDGFYSESSIFYNFAENKKENYLTDWQILKNCLLLNDERKLVLDDKLLFHILNKNNQTVPSIYLSPLISWSVISNLNT